jgi:phage gp29-like protein
MPKRGQHSKNQSRDSKGRFSQENLEHKPKENQLATPPFASVIELQRSYITHFTKILRRSDMSLRQDRQLQRQMRRDPDIMSPLFQRQSAVALLEWEILPEDPQDEIQVEQAKELENMFRNNLMRPIEFFKALLDAVWYGPAAVQITPEQSGDMVVPGEWMPIHSDTLAFTEYGSLAMYVGRRYEGEWEHGPYGLIHKLDDEEREQIVLHTHNIEGPDYEEIEEAAFAYSGRGLRDTVWFQWMMKQTSLQFWMTWIERYGMGVRVGTYPDGNASAQAVMQDVMENLIGDVSVLIPKQSGGEDLYSLDIKEVNSSQAKVFADLIEGYLAGQIKELIIGQTATTEATSTGLGSSVGDEHAETFRRIIQCDALNLADTLTKEFVSRYHEYNYGTTDYKPRWAFSLEKNDPREFMEGVRSYVELGGAVSQSQARQILGITEPEEGEAVLSSEQQQEGDMMEGMGGGQGDIMSQLFGGGMPEGSGEEMPPPPNAGEADKAFREFAKNLKKNRAKK